MVLIDTLISIMFYSVMVYHIETNRFNSLNNKVIEGIVGIGATTIFVIYSYMDGQKFLDSKVDKMLYLISCILQKPILLPILFKNRFKSK